MSQTRLYLTARKPEAAHINSLLEAAFEEDAIPVAFFEEEEQPGQWTVSIYVESDEETTWRVRITDALGGDLFGLTLHAEALGDTNWVEESLKGLAPIPAGRFIVHGSHDRAVPKPHEFAIEIDAGQAFGTGHHGTTAGCLDMLGEVLKQRRFSNVLDLGTGTGVLAIAVARATHLPVFATDIDPIAAQITRQNATANDCGSEITAIAANGFQDRRFEEHGPFDLAIANILAGPLIRLARPMRDHLAPRATLILSGLLPYQKARIVSAYRQQGLVLERFYIRDGWLTLVMSL
ncbi:MAG: 50S ribosomal protein L11 methyltransferase [Pseudomonadota bacterium]